MRRDAATAKAPRVEVKPMAPSSEVSEELVLLVVFVVFVVFVVLVPSSVAIWSCVTT